MTTVTDKSLTSITKLEKIPVSPVTLTSVSLFCDCSGSLLCHFYVQTLRVGGKKDSTVQSVLPQSVLRSMSGLLHLMTVMCHGLMFEYV